MRLTKQIKNIGFIVLTLALCVGGINTGAYAAASDNTSGPGVIGVKTSDTVFHLESNGQDRLIRSGSFEGKDNQVLTITIQSDIQEGSVDLVLFSPDFGEQRFTVTGSNDTKTVVLSAGKWAYNCTGFFKSGTITITGTVPQTPAGTGETAAENGEVTTFRLENGGQYSITESGSFEARQDQTLTLSVRSDIQDGHVDLTLFSPDNQEQRITFGGSDETKTVTLSAGWWEFNCTGFFKSGGIVIVGTVQ